MSHLLRAPHGCDQTSRFPAECGGPLRLKAPWTPGLDIQPHEELRAVARKTGLWNVMFLWKGDRLYLTGTSSLGDPAPAGWVSLPTVARVWVTNREDRA